MVCRVMCERVILYRNTASGSSPYALSALPFCASHSDLALRQEANR